MTLPEGLACKRSAFVIRLHAVTTRARRREAGGAARGLLLRVDAVPNGFGLSSSVGRVECHHRSDSQCGCGKNEELRSLNHGLRLQCHFFRCPRNFSFSRQISSTRSVSRTIFCFNVTVHGFVYALGSSTVTCTSRCPKSGRRICSRTFADSVTTDRKSTRLNSS